MLYSRTLFFIDSIYNSSHLLIPNSQSIPPPDPLPLGNHKSVVYVCESVSVKRKYFLKEDVTPLKFSENYLPISQYSLNHE